MNNTAQKSLYLFLTSLLGMLLFFCLHRMVIFAIIVISSNSGSNFYFGTSYLQFVAWDYISLVVTLILGGWYGIWLGMYWYTRIYEEGSHGGLVQHIVNNYWPTPHKTYEWEKKIHAVQKKLEEDVSHLETLAENVPLPKTIKPRRRVVRRKKTTINN